MSNTPAPYSKPEPDLETPIPGRVATTYWFVLAGGLLTLAVFACYVAVLYGHWHPISFSSHYPQT